MHAVPLLHRLLQVGMPCKAAGAVATHCVQVGNSSSIYSLAALLLLFWCARRCLMKTLLLNGDRVCGIGVFQAMQLESRGDAVMCVAQPRVSVGLLLCFGGRADKYYAVRSAACGLHVCLLLPA